MRSVPFDCASRIIRKTWARVLIYVWIVFTLYLWYQGYSWFTVQDWYYRDARMIQSLNQNLNERLTSIQNLETAKSNLIKEKSQLEGRVKSLENQRQLALITIVTSNDMDKLSQFVGAIHKATPSILIKVYGFGLSLVDIEQISTWKQTEYFDGQKTLLGDSLEYDITQTKPYDLPALVFQAITTNLPLHTYVAYLRHNFVLTENKMKDIFEKLEADGAMAGLDGSLPAPDPAVKSNGLLVTPDYAKYQFLAFYSASPLSKLLVHDVMPCLLGYEKCQIPNTFEKQMSTLSSVQVSLKDYGIEALDKQTEALFNCGLQLHDDLLLSYSQGHYGSSVREQMEKLKTEGRPFKNSVKDTLIGLGILLGDLPKSSHTQSLEDLPVIRLFLNSFINSLSENEIEYFEYKFYIGYDARHTFLSDASGRKQFEQLIQRKITEVNTKLAENGAPKRTRKGPLEPSHLNVDGTIIHEVPFRIPAIRYTLQLVRVPSTRGWKTFQWNALMVHGMKDAIHYFLQLQDGAVTVPETKDGWLESMVQELEAMNEQGVVSPAGPQEDGAVASTDQNEEKDEQEVTVSNEEQDVNEDPVSNVEKDDNEQSDEQDDNPESEKDEDVEQEQGSDSIQWPLVSRSHFRQFHGLYPPNVPDFMAVQWLNRIYPKEKMRTITTVQFTPTKMDLEMDSTSKCFNPEDLQRLVPWKANDA